MREIAPSARDACRKYKSPVLVLAPTWCDRGERSSKPKHQSSRAKAGAEQKIQAIICMMVDSRWCLFERVQKMKRKEGKLAFGRCSRPTAKRSCADPTRRSTTLADVCMSLAMEVRRYSRDTAFERTANHSDVQEQQTNA